MAVYRRIEVTNLSGSAGEVALVRFLDRKIIEAGSIAELGDELVAQLPERTQKFLGYYTRLPATLEQFYLPEEQRLYRAGQD